jgi:hypothetical protein
VVLPGLSNLLPLVRLSCYLKKLSRLHGRLLLKRVLKYKEACCPPPDTKTR